MKNNIRDKFGSPLATNIISASTLTATIVFGIVTASRSFTNQPNQSVGGLNTFSVIVFLILILITIINIFFSQHNRKKYFIIDVLYRLQNKYILEPEFKTAQEHCRLSKEKELTVRGEARILTNSLKYDMRFCDLIADNIKKGAKYIYVIPLASEEALRIELEAYIEKLYKALHDKFAEDNKDDPVAINDAMVKALNNNIVFWLLKEKLWCLYNFAKLEERGEPTFTKAWWYVNPNPEGHNDMNSIMLSNEIFDEDKTQLRKVFDELEKNSRSVPGYDIYQNRGNLGKTYGNK